MATKKKIEEKPIQLNHTDSVKSMVGGILTRKMEVQKEIRALNKEMTVLDEKLNCILISFAEGQGYELKDYNIIEYCDQGRFLIVEKKTKV